MSDFNETGDIMSVVNSTIRSNDYRFDLISLLFIINTNRRRYYTHCFTLKNNRLNFFVFGNNIVSVEYKQNPNLKTKY